MKRDGSKVTFESNIADLPNGTFVEHKHNAFLIFEGLMYLWTPSGYKKIGIIPHAELLQVLTPLSIINTFKAGYLPQITIN